MRLLNPTPFIVVSILSILLLGYIVIFHPPKLSDSKSPPISQTKIDSLINKMDSLSSKVKVYDSLLKVQSVKIDSIESNRVRDVNKINKKYETIKGQLRNTSNDNLDSILLSKKRRY